MATGSGLTYEDFENVSDLNLINNGNVSEQFVGQHLLYKNNYFIPPEIFYWLREKKGSSSEVDYLISIGPDIMPVEVKSGKTGSIKSLQVFLNEKKTNYAVRVNSDKPYFHNANYSLSQMTDKKFKFLSIPFYLICQLNRIIRQTKTL